MVAAGVTWYRIAMRGEWWSCLSMGEFCFHIYSNTSVLAAALNLVDHITSNSSTALALDVYCLLVRRGRGGRSYRMMCCFWVSSLSWESGFYSLFPIPIYVIYYMTYSLITDQASVFIFIYPVQVNQIKSFGIHSKSEKVCGTAFSVKKNCGKSA